MYEQIGDKMIEKLQKILAQQSTKVTFYEAKEIGEQLIEFYKLLAQV
jgi:hypothetical protein